MYQPGGEASGGLSGSGTGSFAHFCKQSHVEVRLDAAFQVKKMATLQSWVWPPVLQRLATTARTVPGTGQLGALGTRTTTPLQDCTEQVQSYV